MQVTSTWSQDDSQRAARQVKEQLELLRRARVDMQRRQLQEKQQLEQQIKIAQDRRDYDSSGKLKTAMYEFEARAKREIEELDKQEREANQNLQMAGQNEERFEQQSKQNQQF